MADRGDVADLVGGGVRLTWSFDTTSIWHTILKGAFGLNALLGLGRAGGRAGDAR